MAPAGQFRQKRLRVLQVRRLKPLSKPPVYGLEQLVGIPALTPALPQAGQAGGGVQFPGFGLLLAGDVEGLLKTWR